MEISKEDAQRFIILALHEFFLQDIYEKYKSGEIKLEQYNVIYDILNEPMTLQVPDSNTYLDMQRRGCNEEINTLLRNYYGSEIVVDPSPSREMYMTKLIDAIHEQYKLEDNNDGN
jgi:hypothetical protein